jgi:hypothetical protein
MAHSSLEKRVLALEQKLDRLITRLENGNHAKDWRQAVGMFTGDEVMKRISEAALQYREADRAKARGQRKKARAK